MGHSTGQQWIQCLKRVNVMNKGQQENKVGEAEDQYRPKETQQQHAVPGHWIIHKGYLGTIRKS